MGIGIKHDEYERWIRQLAAHRGTSMTDAIGQAVKHDLERAGVLPAPATVMERIRRAQAMARAAKVIDPRPYRDILYDGDGLPR